MGFPMWIMLGVPQWTLSSGEPLFVLAFNWLNCGL
jgi:hypothetical protein